MPGLISLYQVFGHAGSVNGPASDAPYVTFSGTSAWSHDNSGSIDATVTMAVPESGSYALMGLALARRG